MLELYQDRESVLHQMSAGVKILFTLVFILCVNLVPPRSWSAYILFLTILASIFIISRLDIKTLLLRSLISLPFILAAIPLLFTSPAPYISFTQTNDFVINISQSGLIRFLGITIKSWLSLVAAILLTCTTRFDSLMAALRQLGLPKIFVSILSLMWRYLSLIIEEAKCLMRSRDSRTASNIQKGHPNGSLWWRAGVTGSMMGNLFLRSLDRSERVYAAMASRGYSGEPFQADIRPITRRESLMLTGAILLCLMIMVFSFIIH